MRLVAGLYRQFDHLVHEMAKFGTIGAVNFVLAYVVINFLRFGVGLGPLTSTVIATCLATTIAYFANRYWTFRHREQSGLGREYFLFFVFNGIGLLVQLLCIGFTTYTLKQEGPLAYNAALTVGVSLGTIFRFWSYKKWVFLPPTLPPVDPHTGLPEATDPAAPLTGASHPVRTVSGGGASYHRTPAQPNGRRPAGRDSRSTRAR